MLKLFLLAAFIAAVLCGCNSTDPVVEQNTLKLTAVDASVTETYLHISLGTLRNNEEITIYRNGTPAIHFTAVSKDTFITDSALSENTIYKYTAVAGINNQETAKSNEVEIKTLLPTSHDFEWKTLIFGDYGISKFSDVEIVDENNVWAVGEMYLKDSLGNNDPDIYGAAQVKDGKWVFHKVMMKGFDEPLWAGPLTSVILINEEIFASSPAHLFSFNAGKWNLEVKFIQAIPFGNQIYEIWGKEIDNIYCVGGEGGIFHVSGNRWERLAYKSEEDITDVWGFTDFTGNTELICSLKGYYDSKNNRILKISENNQITELKNDFEDNVGTVWSNKGYPLYAGGGFINKKTDVWGKMNDGKLLYISQIRGSGLNNIAAATGTGSI